jgi:hypothetical protein
MNVRVGVPVTGSVMTLPMGSCNAFFSPWLQKYTPVSDEHITLARWRLVHGLPVV